MINDKDRGGSWTNAFLGICAFEVHLCGDESAIEIITNICNQIGEELIIKKYERFNQLHLDQPIGSSLENLKERDCIVAFKRSDIFFLKQAIETETNFKCSIVYGSLPYEIRNEQADIFNDIHSGYNILLSTDAIGLGLNLNIRRIIFYSLTKNTKEGVIDLPLSLIKQIGGRAGRRNYYDFGLVTTFYDRDFEMIKNSIHQTLSSTKKIAYTPTFEEFKEFYSKNQKLEFSEALQLFNRLISIHETFFVTNFSETFELASSIDHLTLPLLFRWEILFTGFNRYMKNEFVDICTQFSKGEIVKIRYDIIQNKRIDLHMHTIEEKIKLIDAFLFIGSKYPERFDLVEALKQSEILKRKLSNQFFKLTQYNKVKREKNVVSLDFIKKVLEK